MTQRELEIWLSGYLAGWHRSDELAVLEGRPDMSDVIRQTFKAAEIAAAGRAWREAVLRGENPTPYEGTTDGTARDSDPDR